MTNLVSTDQQLIRIMHALGDPTRFRMFQLLMSGEELCVSEIAGRLDISIPAASQHFKTFELIGLVGKQRHGQRICYMINVNQPLVRKVTKLIKEEV